MSHWVAEFVFRFRRPLCAFIVLGFVYFAPSVNFTEIDNDLTCGSRRPTPSTSPTNGFARNSAASAPHRRAAVEGLFTPGPSSSSGRHRRHRARRHGRARPEPGHRQHRPQPAGAIRRTRKAASRYSRFSTTSIERGRGRRREPRCSGRPAAPRRPRCPRTDGHGVVVTFDEDRIDDVRAGVIERSTRSIDPRLPAGMKAYYNGSLEISETYNRVTLANTKPHGANPGADDRRHLLAVPVVADHRAAGRGRARQRGVDDGPLRGDGVQLQRAGEHAPGAGDDPGHRRRRPHRPALQPRAARDRRQGARVQVERGAPVHAAARRQRHDGARPAVARHERRRRRQGVRHRVRGRRDGGLRDVARVRADAADLLQPGAGVAPQERYLLGPMRRLARFSIRHAHPWLASPSC